jgi:hypothetical protein
VTDNGWYVQARAFSRSGDPVGDEIKLCTESPGSRYAPQIARAHSDFLVVWTSDWQDGSRKGVYGRFVDATGTPQGDEFRVNTTTISEQMHPAVASDGQDRFLVAWSGFGGVVDGFELFAQRYAAGESLAPPAPPYVLPLDSLTLMVSWPELAGYDDLAGYRLYIDEALNPVEVEEPYHVIYPLMPGSTHTVQLAYALDGGAASPRSEPASGTTWGADGNFDGLPDNWQARYWEPASSYPVGHVDSDGDGASNREEFLAGTDPTDAASVLRASIRAIEAGIQIGWEATPGAMYRLQASPDLESWSDVGGPRFAAGVSVAVMVPHAEAASYYRVIRIRQ